MAFRRNISRPSGRLHPSIRPGSGAAFYQLGELRRLRSEFSEADDAYRQANRYGRKPQPGLALLRWARVMRQCSFDLDGLREELGTHWEPFVAYSLERGTERSPRVIANRRPL
jgi:hypothetical protein